MLKCTVECGPYSAGVLHSVSDQIKNLQNCFTTPNKMTSEDNINGLVSLKFLHPCYTCTVGYNEFDFFLEIEEYRPFDGCKIEI